MTTKQTFSNFQEMLTQADTPVLVDFYAPWCGPCQMMATILTEAKAQLGDQLRIVKINTDNYPTLASQHQIQALPTMVLFKQGQAVDRIEGVLRAPELVQRLQPHLSR